MLNLNEPDDALMWLTAFKAKARVEKKIDQEGDLQMTDLFLSRCGLDSLKKISKSCCAARDRNHPL